MDTKEEEGAGTRHDPPHLFLILPFSLATKEETEVARRYKQPHIFLILSFCLAFSASVTLLTLPQCPTKPPLYAPHTSHYPVPSHLFGHAAHTYTFGDRCCHVDSSASFGGVCRCVKAPRTLLTQVGKQVAFVGENVYNFHPFQRRH